MDGLRQLRIAARTLRRQPALSATIILTLALGVGVNCVMFSLNRALIADALPFGDPDRLLTLSETVERDGLEPRTFSYPDFVDLRQLARSFDTVAIFDPQAISVTLGDGDVVVRVMAERIGDSYFATLAVAPASGREIEGEAETQTVVLGHNLATQLFGDAATAVGRVVRIGVEPLTVVGVMPQSFRGASDAAELWFPMRLGDPTRLERRNSRFLSAIGRLHTETTIEEARAELETIFTALAEAHPQSNRGYGATATAIAETMLGALRDTTNALLVCVGFVMLVACLNLSNLLVSRSAARRHEDAVRVALGAGRLRLAYQAAAEIGILTLAGGVLGVVLAAWGIDLLRILLPVSIPTFVSFQIDLGTLAFAFGLAFVTGLAFTVILSFGRSDRSWATAGRGSRATTADVRTSRLRATLVAGQVGLALVLAIGAGLLGRSLLALGSVDLGFGAQRLMTFRIDQPDDRPEAAAVEVARGLIERLGGVPGVEAVALASDLPLDGRESATIVAAEGQTGDPEAVYGGGVVGDVRYRTLVDFPGTPLDPDLYLPLNARAYGNLAVAVREAPEGAPTAEALSATMRQIDSRVPLYTAARMESLLEQRLGRARFSATLMSTFAIMALLLACIGVHGTVAFAVAQRTREIGIRIAVGSTRGAVLRRLLGDGMRLVIVGSAFGLPAALVGVRLLQSQLVAVGPADPLAFLGATLIVATTASVACALPAQRASRLDPVRALRTE